MCFYSCPSNILHAFLMPYSWFNRILITQNWNNAPLLFFSSSGLSLPSLIAFALTDNIKNTQYLFIFIYVPKL